MRALWVVAFCFPLLASAKTKVLLDAPKSATPAFSKALKKNHSVAPQSFASEPTAGDVKDACRLSGAIAIVSVKSAAGILNVTVLNGADGNPLSTFRIKVGKKPLRALAKPDLQRLLIALKSAKAPSKKEEAAPPPPQEPAAEASEEKKDPEAKQPEAEEKAEAKPEPKPEPPPEVKPKEEAPPERRRLTKRRSEPTPQPVEKVEPEPEPEEKVSKSSGPSALTALRVGVGFKLFSRSFKIIDDIFGKVADYKLPLGPAVMAEVELYPAAFFTSGIAANIGLMGEFAYAFAINSRTADNSQFGTSAMAFKVLATYRIPISILTLQPIVGFSRQTYSISNGTTMTGSTIPRPNIPTALYNALEAGALFKLQVFGPLAIQVYGAYLALLSTGELAKLFPRSSGNGLDAGGALTVDLFDRLEIKLGASYTRYGFAMNPQVGDTYVAGGALDWFFAANALVSFKL